MKFLPPKALEFLDWFMLPEEERKPRSVLDWCFANEVGQSTVYRWQKSKEWKRAVETYGQDADYDNVTLSEEDTEQVIDALRKKALDGDTNAAKAYLQFAVALAEPDDEDVRNMTDEQLAAALEQAAIEVRSRA